MASESDMKETLTGTEALDATFVRVPDRRRARWILRGLAAAGAVVVVVAVWPRKAPEVPRPAAESTVAATPRPAAIERARPRAGLEVLLAVDPRPMEPVVWRVADDEQPRVARAIEVAVAMPAPARPRVPHITSGGATSSVPRPSAPASPYATATIQAGADHGQVHLSLPLPEKLDPRDPGAESVRIDRVGVGSPTPAEDLHQD